MLSNTMFKIYKNFLHLEYDPCENSFYDDEGFHVDNILSILTPNDLLIFRNDHEYNVFPCWKDRTTLCIIAVRGEEDGC